MHPATSYSSRSSSDQEQSVNEYPPIIQSQPVHGNMHTFSMLPQIPGHSISVPYPFYTGPPQDTYHPSFPGPSYGYVMQSPVSIILPNVPIILPHFSFIPPQVTGAVMYNPFPFQPVLPQMMYQPYINVGHISPLIDPRMSSIAPYVNFLPYNEQPRIAYQPPVEPAQSRPSFDPTSDEGRQPPNFSAPSQMQSVELVPITNIYPSSSNCVELSQRTYKSSLGQNMFGEGQQPLDSILPSRVQSARFTNTTDIYPSSFDPGIAFCGEQMFEQNIPHQVLGAGTEHSYAHQELRNDPGTTRELYPSCPMIYSEEPQSTYLSSFQPAFDNHPDLSGSVNQDHSSLNDHGSQLCEPSNPLAVPDFQQITSPRDSDLTSPFKRTADEIYPPESEMGSSRQLATTPPFKDAPRPRKRLKEADIDSTSCFPEERIQSLATPYYRGSPSPESFPTNSHRIFYDQPMDVSVQRSMARNDTSMFRGAHEFSIRGNPSFTTIGVNNVNHSGAHDLEILTKFVSFDALHDSSIQDPDRRCYPGTRVSVLAQLEGWIKDSTASDRIIWLHGLPGAGKSSIAQTITRLCGREVVATFFFYRSDPSRNNGNRLFTTIAWQLASSIPGVKSYLVNSLAHRPDLPTKEVETQFEELIIQPFHDLSEGASHLEQSLAPVVVIDGVDECLDEKLQRRILNVIGNAIRDRRIPLRFLILSRSEAHIEETVDQFGWPIRCIDLEMIDNANYDIELYFNAEFSCIADKRGFDTSWPGGHVIQELVCNSSGQFVYAATVIKYVGDEFCCAKSQLDIILGLRKRPSASPFAPLDELYTEILKRQPDQDFLKDVLTLLVTCSSIEEGFLLHEDFPQFLNVSEQEMARKLRGMRSLLAFSEKPCLIDIHHRSFLDFLQDMSRSAQYHINKRASHRRYLEFLTDTVVRHVSDEIDQPQWHDMQHLHLSCSYDTIWCYGLEPELVVEDLREVLQPLVDLQNHLLNLPNFAPSRKPSGCDSAFCNSGFQIMRNLLSHLALSEAKSYCVDSSSRETRPLMVEQEAECSTISALPNIEVENKVSDKDLDTDFASLVAYLRNIPSTSSPTVSVLELMYSLLYRFDCVEIAKKVSTVLDAQNLANLIHYYMIHDQSSVKNDCMNLTWKAFHLVREIHARVPVVPQSLLQYEINYDSESILDHSKADSSVCIEDLCVRALMVKLLNRRYICGRGPILERNARLSWVVDEIMDKNLHEWSRDSNTSHSAMFQVMLELAKSIQYFHSVGTGLSCDTHLGFIFLDSELHPKIPISYLTIKGVTTTLKKHTYESESTSVFILGRLFYEMYFNVEVPWKDYHDLKRDAIVKRPSKWENHEDAWQLVQRCCAEDPESRPTIDEIIQEIEAYLEPNQSPTEYIGRRTVEETRTK